jgi:hypothetical protein
MASLVVILVAGLVAPSWPWLFIAILAAGIVEGWLALRVAFDADLFAALAREDGDLASFDAAMLNLGLMPAERQVGTVAQRAKRAIRLLKWQGACLLVQVLLLAGGFASFLIMRGR